MNRSECGRYQELISAYIDDELNPAELAVLAEHLKICDGCGREMESLLTVTANLHGSDPFWPRAEAGPEFAERCLRPLSMNKAPAAPWTANYVRPRSYRSWVLAAAAAVLLAVGIVTFERPGLPPGRIGTDMATDAKIEALMAQRQESLENYIREHAIESSENLLVDYDEAIQLAEYRTP